VALCLGHGSLKYHPEHVNNGSLRDVLIKLSGSGEITNEGKLTKFHKIKRILNRGGTLVVRTELGVLPILGVAINNSHDFADDTGAELFYSVEEWDEKESTPVDYNTAMEFVKDTKNYVDIVPGKGSKYYWEIASRRWRTALARARRANESTLIGTYGKAGPKAPVAQLKGKQKVGKSMFKRHGTQKNVTKGQLVGDSIDLDLQEDDRDRYKPPHRHIITSVGAKYHGLINKMEDLIREFDLIDDPMSPEQKQEVSDMMKVLLRKIQPERNQK